MRQLLLACLCLTLSLAPARSEATYSILPFDGLNGWKDDDHKPALAAFLETCIDLKTRDWAPICAYATSNPNPRKFFELFFRPVLIENGEPGLFTGYFEPELSGSRRRSYRYRYPIYMKPPELNRGKLWFTRKEIEDKQILANRGLEIVWADNSVDVFFLQIQGSGRIRMDDGSVVRVGYDAANGHTYRSIGAELVRRGTYDEHQVSAEVIRNWVGRNPISGEALLQTNPSYVFFRELKEHSPNKGPLGAMNRPITANRTVAVDPSYVKLGAPVWIEKGGANAIRRLMIAQDTGSAIKGAQRADIFFGTGYDAGRAAGRVRDPGRLVVLLPIETAFALIQGAE